MKVNRLLGMLGIVAILASCSNEDGLLGSVNEKGEVAVRISAALPTDGMITRADSETDGLRCFVQVLNADGGSVEISEMNGSSGSYSSTLYLEPNQQYSFLFWADNATGSAPTSLTNVSYNTNGSTIAFAGNKLNQEWSTDEVKVTLTHVVSRITLKTTGTLNSGSAVTVSVPANTTYSTYDVSSNTPGGASSSAYTYTHTPTSQLNGSTSNPVEVCHFYVLTSSTTDNSTLTIGYNNHSQAVSNVPLAPNKHVTLQGDIAHIGLESVTFTATIDTEWGKPDDDPTEF